MPSLLRAYTRLAATHEHRQTPGNRSTTHPLDRRIPRVALSLSMYFRSNHEEGGQAVGGRREVAGRRRRRQVARPWGGGGGEEGGSW